MVERFVEAAPGFVINVLGRCADMAQFCGAHAAFKAFGFSARALTVDEQPQPFSMAERGCTVLYLHLSKGFRHAVEPECFELIQRWMIKHILSSSMEVIRTTDIGVSDRGAVRGGLAARAIQTILENGM
jgi:hypothetical protein